jgi:hypothetical protein
MPAPSLALYRELIDEHATIGDTIVEKWLSFAICRHADASVWGAVYGDAMVFYAAHRVLRDPASGLGTSASAPGAVTSQRDGDLSRTYAQPAAAVGSDADLATTTYGSLYLELRDSRAASAPMVVCP